MANYNFNACILEGDYFDRPAILFKLSKNKFYVLSPGEDLKSAIFRIKKMIDEK